MGPAFIAAITIIAFIVLWIISTQRKLVVLDKNISNAMSQIGVQLSDRFGALNSLLDYTKGYAKHESEVLIDTINSKRRVISAKSTPDDVMLQEEIISDVLVKLAWATKQYPELRADQKYIKIMDAVQTYENKARTSRLIYNDSVIKLNREVRTFPGFMIAGILGFRQRDYIVHQEAEAGMHNGKLHFLFSKECGE